MAAAVLAALGAAQAAGPVLFQDGLAVVEAEDFDAKTPRSSHDWVAGQSPSGSVADALKAAPDTGARLHKQVATTSPELAYRVLFPAAGTYQLWLRTYAVPKGNTLHAGLDGEVTAQNVTAPVGSWNWVKASLDVPSAGVHTVQLWMREDGLSVDRLLLADSAAYAPSDAGPAVTPRQGAGGDTTPPTVADRQPAPGATDVSVGADVVATFSEAMDPATVTSSSFTLAPSGGGPAVAATVTAAAGNTVFTLNPSASLAFATAYTATVTTAATDAAGNPLAAAQTWSFTTAAAPDTTPPTLTGRQPAVGATGVAVGTNVVATFSEAMDPASITSTSFTLAPSAGGPAVPAAIAASAGDTVFTLDPAADLQPSTAYTATVTTAATDAAGNPIANAQSWSFTTTAASDTTPPTVTGRQPAPDATGVAVGTDVVATFSEPMNAATVDAASFTLAPAAGGATVPAAIAASAGDTVFTLDPAAALLPGTAYTATVSSGAKDLAGNPLVSSGWTFTTGPAPSDATAPALVARTPAPGATAVPAGTGVAAGFSEAMSPATVTVSSFRLVRNSTGEPVPATIAPSAGNATFTLQPRGPLAAGTSYTATVTPAVRDAAGNPLAAAQSWSFTTAVPATDGGGGSAGPVTFQGGLAVVEIEDFDQRVARSSRDWVAGTSPPGSAGGSLQAAPDAGAAITSAITTSSPELVYRVFFPTAGTYHVWVRGYPPNTAGNSAYLGLDGTPGPSYLFNNTFGAWGWMGKLFSGPRATVGVPSAGEHTVHLWMREDGFHLDRLLLTADPAYTPTGSGPPVTPREGSSDAMAPVVIERSPTPGAASVPQGAPVVVRFSEPMDPSTLTGTSVQLAPAGGGAAVPATVTASSDGRSAMLDPSASLAAGTAYRVTVTTAARDVAGNGLAASDAWTFTTRTPVRYEPADGRIYSGVSTRGVDENLDAFLAVSNQPSVAIHNRFNRRDPAGFGPILADLKRKDLTGMISWAFFEGTFYSPTTPGANHASIARGDLDGYILDRAAEVRAHGDPLFLRLHWEMNHSSFPWAVFDGNGMVRQGNSHADFRASWRRAVILFRGGTRQAVNAALAAEGLPGLITGAGSIPATTNVAWVWTPGASGSQSAADVHDYWPGDAYVDWAGVDWYPHGSGDAGVHQARADAPGGPNELYRRYSELAEAAGKPFMIGEWGVFGLDRPVWVADMFAWLAARPMAKAQLYFNIDADDSNSQLQDYPQSAAAFRTGIAGSRWIRDPGAVGSP